MHWSQLLTILWLRWRLSRNQWSRGGPLNAVIAVAVIVCLITGAVGGALAGLLVGLFALTKVSPGVMLAVWDITIFAFLLVWTIGILSEIQRSEAIDIGKMLHLPVSLRGVFLVNYAASHLTLSIILFGPWMVGLSIGLALSRGWAMLWLLPLSLGLLFMVTAWTYYVRGWLVILMRNPRRYRAVVAGITLAFILLSQLPNLLMNASQRHPPAPGKQVAVAPPKEPAAEGDHLPAHFSTLLWLHKVVPFLWVGNGAMSLAGGSAWPAALGAAGTLALGGLGLGRAYRSTRRFYEGRTGKTKKRRSAKEKALAARQGPEALPGAKSRLTFLERTVPGVPQEAGALALAAFRSLLRATEVKMALAASMLGLVTLFAMMIFSHGRTVGIGARPFLATAAVVLPLFGMTQLMLNQFGFDRAGFRMLVLSPVPRWQILLGKNLALVPLAVSIGLFVLLLVKFVLAIPWLVIVAACLQLGTAFLLLSMLGNLFSLFVPYWISPGSLRPTKVPAMTSILIVLSHLLFSTAMTPIFLAPICGWLFASAGLLPAAAANLLFSAIELAILLALYRLTLPGFGDLLQKREKQILQIVTREVE
jgi:hypothetical protein